MSNYYNFDFSAQYPTDISGGIDISYLYNGFEYCNGYIKSKAIGSYGVAHSYIKFNATRGDIVTISAYASCQNLYDYGIAAVTQSTDVPTSGFVKCTGTTGTYENACFEILFSGTYYLHFVYTKDGYGYSGSDAFYINSISLPNDASFVPVSSYIFNFRAIYPTDVPSSIDYSQLYTGFTCSISSGSDGSLMSKTIKDNESTHSYIKFGAKAGQEVIVSAQPFTQKDSDYGLACVTNSDSYPSDSEDYFMKISGYMSADNYFYTIPADGTYFLHLIYKKDSSGKQYNDLILINRLEIPVATVTATPISSYRTFAIKESIVTGGGYKDLTLKDRITYTSHQELALEETIITVIVPGDKSLVLKENAAAGFGYQNLALSETIERSIYNREYVDFADYSNTRAKITHSFNWASYDKEINGMRYYGGTSKPTLSQLAFLQLKMRASGWTTPVTPVEYKKIGFKVKYANIALSIEPASGDKITLPLRTTLSDWIDVEITDIPVATYNYPIYIKPSTSTNVDGVEFMVKDVYVERLDIKADFDLEERITEKGTNNSFLLNETVYAASELTIKDRVIVGMLSRFSIVEDIWDGNVFTRRLPQKEEIMPRTLEYTRLYFTEPNRFIDWELSSKNEWIIEQNSITSYSSEISDTDTVTIKIAETLCRTGNAFNAMISNRKTIANIYYNNELVYSISPRELGNWVRVDLTPGATEIKIVYERQLTKGVLCSITFPYVDFIRYDATIPIREEIYPLVQLYMKEYVTTNQLAPNDAQFFQASYTGYYDKENALFYNYEGWSTYYISFYIYLLRYGDLHFDLNLSLEEDQKLIIYSLANNKEYPEQIIYFDNNTTNGWQHISMPMYPYEKPNWEDGFPMAVPEARIVLVNDSYKPLPEKAIQIKNILLYASIEDQAALRLREYLPIVGQDAIVMAENIWDKKIALQENILAATDFNLKDRAVIQDWDRLWIKQFNEKKPEGYKTLLLKETVKEQIHASRDLELPEEIKLRPGEFDYGDLTISFTETIHLGKNGFNQIALSEKVFNDFDIRYKQEIYSRDFSDLSKVQESGGRPSALTNYAREPEVFIYKALRASVLPIYSNTNRMIIDLRGNNHDMTLRLPARLNYYDGSINFEDSPNYTLKVFRGIALPTTYVSIDSIYFIQVYAFDANNNKALLPMTNKEDGYYYYDIPSTNTYRIEVFLTDTIKAYPIDSIFSMPLDKVLLMNAPVLNQTFALKENIVTAPTTIALDEYLYEEKARRFDKVYTFQLYTGLFNDFIIETPVIGAKGIAISFKTNKPITLDDFEISTNANGTPTAWMGPVNAYFVGTAGDKPRMFCENLLLIENFYGGISQIRLTMLEAGFKVTGVDFVAAYVDDNWGIDYSIRKYSTDSLYLREYAKNDFLFKDFTITEWVTRNSYYEHDTRLFDLSEKIAPENCILAADTCWLYDYIAGYTHAFTLPVKEDVKFSTAPIAQELFEYIDNQFVPYTNNPAYFMNGYIFIKANWASLNSRGYFDYSVIRSAVGKNKYAIAFNNPKTKQLDFYYFESYDKLDDFRPYINYLLKYYNWYGIKLSDIQYIGILLEEAIVKDLIFKWLLSENAYLPITEDLVSKGKIIDINVIKYSTNYLLPDRVVELPYAKIYDKPIYSKIWVDINLRDTGIVKPTAARPRIMEQIALETNFAISKFIVNDTIYPIQCAHSGTLYRYYMLERPIECLTMEDKIEIYSNDFVAGSSKYVFYFGVYYRELPRAVELRMREHAIQPYGELSIKENILETGLKKYFPLKEYALFKVSGAAGLFTRERILNGNELFGESDLSIQEWIDAPLTKNSLLLTEIVRTGELIKDTLELQEIVKPKQDKTLFRLRENIYGSKFNGVDGKVMLEVIK